MAPIYPFAFAALTFAFLGAPRTTRQSRNFSIGGSILAVFGLRMAGFACSVMAVKSPLAAARSISDAGRGDRRRPLDHHRGRRDRTAGRAAGGDQQIERASACGFSDGRPPHEHDDQHARAIFCRPLRDLGAGRVCQHLRAAGAGRLHRNGQEDLGAGFGIRRHGRGNVAVPRAATARKDDAVLHADRGDDLLPGACRGGWNSWSRAPPGVSAWQFIAPALASSIVLGILATTAYNPMSANLRELSKRMEAELFGSAPGGGIQDASGFWINQVNSDGQAIINAARSEQQGVRLTGLTVFTIRHRLPVQGANRGARGDARGRPLGVQIRAAILPRRGRRSTRTASSFQPA